MADGASQVMESGLGGAGTWDCRKHRMLPSSPIAQNDGLRSVPGGCWEARGEHRCPDLSKTSFKEQSGDKALS